MPDKDKTGVIYVGEVVSDRGSGGDSSGDGGGG